MNQTQPAQLSQVYVVTTADVKAQKFAALLKDLGFEVHLKENLAFEPLASSFILLELNGFQFAEVQNFLKTHHEKNSQLRIGMLVSPSSRSLLGECSSEHFDDLFYWEVDEEFVLDVVFECVEQKAKTVAESHQMVTMAQIQVLDLNSSEPLPFDVHVCLPHNGKFILYRRTGTLLEAAARERFVKFKKYSLFVQKQDLSKVYEHTADFIQTIRQEVATTKIQRDRKVRHQLRDLIGHVMAAPDLTPEDLSTHIRRIDRSLELLEPAPPEKVLQLVRELGSKQLTFHTHARNVASYCRLFGCALGEDALSDLHMGGFLHDLGLFDLPSELLGMSVESMSETELAQFKLHPGNGKMTLLERGNHFSERIQSMILHHHESVNGNGFPYGIKANEISTAARICAIADEFDYLTSVKHGKSTLAPEQAMSHIREQAERDGRFDLEMVVKLQSLFSTQSKASTELFSLLSSSNLDEISAMLARPDVNINEANAEGVTPFSAAASGGNLEALKLLEAAGADMNAADIDGTTPIMHAIESEKSETVNYLLSKAINELDPSLTDLEMFDSEIKAATKAQAESKTKNAGSGFWVKSKLDINKLDKNGNSALMLAVTRGAVDAVAGMLASGADPSLRNAQGMSALDIANVKKNREIIKLLKSHLEEIQDDVPQPEASRSEERLDTSDETDLQKGQKSSKSAKGPKGIDVKARNKRGQTVIMQLAAKGVEKQLQTVIEIGADVNAKDFDGTTALMFALRNGHTPSAKLLVERGAKTRAFDGKGRSILFYAIESGKVDSVQFCIDQKVELSSKTKAATPLMLAASLGSIEIVKALLLAHANVGDVDRSGRTAIQYAEAAKHSEIADLLKQFLKSQVTKKAS